MCNHGHCLNHDPEWENVGKKRLELNPTFFGLISTYVLFGGGYHCGKPMVRYKEVQTKRCKKCGREEEFISNNYLAVCECCGYHTSFVPSD